MNLPSRTTVLAAALSAGLLIGGVGKAAPSSDALISTQAQDNLESLTTQDGPGATVLIARGDTVIYRAARGQANIELRVPLSTDGTFRIASVTKMFTAAMVLKLCEEGKLSLDDPLAKYLPDFPNAQAITIRQLLNHTAGISDIVHNMPSGYTRLDVKTAALVAQIAKSAPSFAPGAGWSYSNSGFILLGAVIEKITGKPWHVAIQTQLLEPLGIKQTMFGAASPLIPGRVEGYSTDEKTHLVTNAAYVSSTVPAAAGGLVSTADDMLRWMRALSHGRVIGAQDFQRMITPTPKLPGSNPGYDYGFGMYIWHVRGALMIGHTGQIDGFASAAVYLPEQDITVVVLANDDDFDARTAVRRLAAIALGQPYVEGSAVPLSEIDMQSLAGTYRVDDQTIRTLSVRDGTLYAQRGTGNVIPLQMTDGQQLHLLPDELTYWVPVRDAAGRVTGLDYFQDGDGPARLEPRIQ